MEPPNRQQQCSASVMSQGEGALRHGTQQRKVGCGQAEHVESARGQLSHALQPLMDNGKGKIIDTYLSPVIVLHASQWVSRIALSGIALSGIALRGITLSGTMPYNHLLYPSPFQHLPRATAFEMLANQYKGV